MKIIKARCTKRIIWWKRHVSDRITAFAPGEVVELRVYNRKDTHALAVSKNFPDQADFVPLSSFEVLN